MLIWGSQRNRSRSRSNQRKSQSDNSLQKPLSQNAKTLPYNHNKSQKQKYSGYSLPNQSKQNGNSMQQIKYDKFQKYGISNEKLKQLYKIFTKYDKDSNGRLSLSQFQLFMKQGGQVLNYSCANDIYHQIKSIKNNGIQFIDLVDILYLPSSHNRMPPNLDKVFRKFDKHKRGWFDFEDYYFVTKTIRQEFNIQELKEAFQFMDQNKDGKITLQQFKKAMLLNDKQK